MEGTANCSKIYIGNNISGTSVFGICRLQQRFMKLFRTGSIDVVQECRSYFGIELP